MIGGSGGWFHREASEVNGCETTEDFEFDCAMGS